MKFAASQKIDPQAGTVIFLARCYEETGKLASAWVRYIEAADMAKRARQESRRVFAEKKATELEPRVPRLRIQLSEELAALPGLTVIRNGEPIGTELVNTATPVDPGPHEVTINASGYRPFTGSATAEEGKEVVIEVVLEPVPPGAEEGTETTPAGTGEPAAAGGSSRKTVAYAVGGVGAAALAVGLGFGLSARSAWNDAVEAGCNEDNPNDDGTIPCSLEGDELAGKARSRAMISNIAIGVGAVAVAAGVVLYVTAPSGEERAALVPQVGPDQVGVVFTGRF